MYVNACISLYIDIRINKGIDFFPFQIVCIFTVGRCSVASHYLDTSKHSDTYQSGSYLTRENTFRLTSIFIQTTKIIWIGFIDISVSYELKRTNYPYVVADLVVWNYRKDISKIKLFLFLLICSVLSDIAALPLCSQTFYWNMSSRRFRWCPRILKHLALETAEAFTF